MRKVEKRKKNLTHLFFVDDLKTYAKNMNDAKHQLDVITTFSKDIGMKFEEDKCGYINVERSKQKSLGKCIEINGVKIKEMEEGEPYRYLGIDETIGYSGKFNKERVACEYYRRVKKIWISQLNSKNKTIAHNCFAIPVLTPTLGILDWTLEEIEKIDMRTRKILCMAGNFHMKSDINRLYCNRKEGGRGLNNFENTYELRTAGIRRHIIRDKE